VKVTIAPDEWLRPIPSWVNAFAEVARRFSFRPGVEIHLRYEPEMDMLEIGVMAEATDARDWDRVEQRRAKVYSPFKVPGLMVTTGKSFDVGRAKDTLIHALRTLEQHEFDEWLRFDGEHVRNPHPPISNRFVG
jgi:hypothetical protein